MELLCSPMLWFLETPVKITSADVGNKLIHEVQMQIHISDEEYSLNCFFLQQWLHTKHNIPPPPQFCEKVQF